MIEQFRKVRFSSYKANLLKQIIEIIDEYEKQKIKLTLRQLYYQLVSRDLIPNSQKEYSKLSNLVTRGRYGGLIDWDAIVDRHRTQKIHPQFDSILDLIKAAKNSYRLDRWEGQDYYVELFTEKDALASILNPIADKWHIYFCVNKGYSSATAMYDTAKRIEEALNTPIGADPNNADTKNKKAIILYLGDHDPSGLDMVRDIRERIVEFLIGDIINDDYKFANSRKNYIEEKIEVIHIALTTEQVKKYRPPPNPAKMTDPRSTHYVFEFGKTSWEVDALKPEIMIRLVDNAISEYVDMNKMQKVIDKEKETIKPIEELASKLSKGD